MYKREFEHELPGVFEKFHVLFQGCWACSMFYTNILCFSIWGLGFRVYYTKTPKLLGTPVFVWWFQGRLRSRIPPFIKGWWSLWHVSPSVFSAGADGAVWVHYRFRGLRSQVYIWITGNHLFVVHIQAYYSTPKAFFSSSRPLLARYKLLWNSYHWIVEGTSGSFHSMKVG